MPPGCIIFLLKALPSESRQPCLADEIQTVCGYSIILVCSHPVFFHYFPESAAPCRPAQLFLIQAQAAFVQGLQRCGVEVAPDAGGKVGGSGRGRQLVSVHPVNHIVARSAGVVGKDGHAIGGSLAVDDGGTFGLCGEQKEIGFLPQLHIAAVLLRIVLVEESHVFNVRQAVVLLRPRRGC